MSWCSKFSYLADVFRNHNELNEKIHGKKGNHIFSTYKLLRLRSKLTLWCSYVEKGKIKRAHLKGFPCPACIQIAQCLALSLSIWKSSRRALIFTFHQCLRHSLTGFMTHGVHQLNSSKVKKFLDNCWEQSLNICLSSILAMIPMLYALPQSKISHWK